MAKSKGLRSGTRYSYSRKISKNSHQTFRVNSIIFRVGDRVDIIANASVQKGLPHKQYHGKTGVVCAVTKSSLCVSLLKPVGRRYIRKRIIVRVEHVRLSRLHTPHSPNIQPSTTTNPKVASSINIVKRCSSVRADAHVVKLPEEPLETVLPLAYEAVL